MELHDVLDDLASDLENAGITYEEQAIEMIAHRADGDEHIAHRILDKALAVGAVTHIGVGDSCLLVTVKIGAFA